MDCTVGNPVVCLFCPERGWVCSGHDFHFAVPSDWGAATRVYSVGDGGLVGAEFGGRVESEK